MTVPDEISQHIRLLSDTDMYQRAISFAREGDGVNSVPKKQYAGLMEFSRSWNELNSFVKHQKGRDWGKKEDYKSFFTAMQIQLDQLRRDVREKYGLVPAGLTKTETNQITDLYAGLLARSFIEHLVAEMLYKRRNERG